MPPSPSRMLEVWANNTQLRLTGEWPSTHALRGPRHRPSAWPGGWPRLGGSVVVGGVAGHCRTWNPTPACPACTDSPEPSQFLFFYRLPPPLGRSRAWLEPLAGIKSARASSARRAAIPTVRAIPCCPATMCAG